MEDRGLAFHYVCTREEAWELVREHGRFWVSNCGCREGRGRCQRSRMDVCLLFREDFIPTGSGFREVSLAEVQEVFCEAEEKHLVTRPFRNEVDRARIDGICFCCDDCCAYFLDPSERCDKGDRVASTDSEHCSDCGACVEVCYFGARRLDGERLAVDRDRCYGCGLCVDVCPEDSVHMTARA